MQWKLFGIVSVGFDATGQLLIIYSAFIKYLRKKWNTMKQCISYLHCRNVYDSVGGRSSIIFSLSLVSP